MKQYSLLLFIGLALSGCKTTSHPELPQIVLSMNAPEILLKTSDLTDNIRIIPLETRDSSLLPDQFKILTGKDCILTIGTNEILQFDLQGKFIRRLATKGRGPEDYQSYYNAVINDKNNLLYLSEWSNALCIYNLEDGKFIERKTTPFPIGKIFQIKDDTLLCEPYTQTGDTAKYRLCQMTLDGKILNKLPSQHIAKMFSGVFSYQLPDGKIRLQSHSKDSLYTVDHFQKKPYATILCTDNKDTKFTLSIIPYSENSNYHLIYVVPMYFQKDHEGNIKSVTIIDSQGFLADKQTNIGKQFKELYIDTLGISVPVQEISISDKLIIPVKPRILREITEKQLKKGKISPALETLYQNIEEEDNPILIIGKCKP